MAYTLNIYFPQFWRNWRLGSPRSRCWQIEFLTTRALLLACSWQPSCSMVTWQTEAEAEKETEKASSSGLSSSSYKDTNPIMGPTLLVSSKPNCLPKAPPPYSITLRVRVSAYDWEEQKHSAHSTPVGSCLDDCENSYFLSLFPFLPACFLYTAAQESF